MKYYRLGLQMVSRIYFSFHVGFVKYLSNFKKEKE